MRSTILVLWAICLLLPGFSQAAFDSADLNKPKSSLEILSITPSGDDVPTGRQIVIKFNQPVVPVGRMERRDDEIPISITPALKCEWRWMNTNTLACQLDQNNTLKLATRYEMEIRPGIRTEQGVGMTDTHHHSFVTSRPMISNVYFGEWRGPGTPIIRIRFNQQVVGASLPTHLSLRSNQGTHPFRIEIDPQVKEAVDKLREQQGGKASQQDDGDAVFGVISEGTRRLFFEGKPAASDITTMAMNANVVWTITPTRPLPLDSEIFLDVAPGIEPFPGLEKGVENRTALKFHTYPEFRVVMLECYDQDQRKIEIRNGDLRKSSICDPEYSYRLLFSTPVNGDTLQNGLKIDPQLGEDQDKNNPWSHRYYRGRRTSPHYPNNRYQVYLPPGIKPFTEYAMKGQRNEIRDIFDRPMLEDLNIAFKTDHYRPWFSVTHPMSVLEKGVGTWPSASTRNVDRLDLDYNGIMSGDGSISSRVSIPLQKPVDEAYTWPLDTRRLLAGQSGVVTGHWTTSPPTPKQYVNGRYNWFFSQVTPYHVHVKTGHYDSLVWVTDMRTGEPVEGATVTLYEGRYEGFRRDEIHGTVTTGKDGVGKLPGLKQIDPNLALINSYGNNTLRLFVHVEKGADIALLPLDYSFTSQIGSGGTSVDTRLAPIHGHIRTWGHTAQGVHRAGETIRYKIYVRDQSDRRFVAPPLEGYRLRIIDPMGKEVVKQENITLSPFGTLSGEYEVPKKAPVGWYTFQLSYPAGHRNWQPLRVLVADFTPSPFRVNTELHGKQFTAGKEIEITTTASLHAGGPYANAQSRVTAIVNSLAFVPRVKIARDFHFNTGMGYTRTIHQSEASVDDRGELTTKFVIPESDVAYGSLSVESAVRDDRGKYIASSASARYIGRQHYAGIRVTDWVFKAGKEARVDGLIMENPDRIKSGVPLEIEIQYRETKATRVKGAGNAYLTNYTHSWVKRHSCSLVSEANPVSCRFVPDKAGYYQMIVSSKDSKNRMTRSVTTRWATGSDHVLWESREGQGLNLIAEKPEYKVGETARYLVQNPFPGATALITIERFGVQEHFVKKLPNSLEVLEIPVVADSLPGFYVSVAVTSPRAAEAGLVGGVDLGKPAYRIGYARTEVKDPAKELLFEIRTDKKSYKPRQTAVIELQARDQQGRHPDMEFAVAVLDESVYDLIQGKTRYFDPYKGFYTLDPLDLRNFNLLTRIVGQQKFDRKGANPGGGGGGAPPGITVRSIFKYLSYWNPSIKPDQQGRAKISVELPDNLTGWRILAIAVTPDDLMGLGQDSFTVNKQTEIRPALPNQVTEGDTFDARFTVMNRADKARKLKVQITAKGAVADGKDLNRTLTIDAAPYQRQVVRLPTRAGKHGTITYVIKAWDDADSDGVELKVPVHRLQSLETAATYGTSTREKIVEHFEFPGKIRTDVGNISVVTSPSVIANLDGAFSYLRDYPYMCWEQRLTKGSMASHYNNLNQYLPDSLTWPGSRSLPGTTLRSAPDFQAPNGGMTYFVPRNDRVSPYLSAYTAIAFNWLRRAGEDIPQGVENRLHGYLRDMLRKEVFPDFYSRGMASSVRAVALAALSERKALQRRDVMRYENQVAHMDLFGKAHYLKALVNTPNTDSQQHRVADLIRSHANETGGKFTFSENLEFAYSRIHASELRTNCAVLSAWMDYETRGAGKTRQSDLPFKLVNYITQSRGNRAHWENTQENMFCMDALIRYAEEYESEKPDMRLEILKAGKKFGEAAFRDFRDEPVTVKKDIDKNDPGKKMDVEIRKQGKGRYYYSARMTYSPVKLRTDPINAGMTIRREYSVERDGKWQLLKSGDSLAMGELVRVDLFVNLPAARNFVVVSDPLPGGLEPVNRDLATTSTVDADKGKFIHAQGSFWYSTGEWRAYGWSWWSFYHMELRHDRADFYSEYLPSGDYHLSYTAQAIAPGEFSAMPSHVEEMYQPDTFGKGVPMMLKIIEEK